MIKKIVFVFLFIFSVALSQPIPIDKYRKVNGIRFFGDDQNLTLFYYLPKEFKIKEDENGKKMFRFYFNTASEIHYCDCSMTLDITWPTEAELDQYKRELGAQTFQKAPIKKLFLEHVGVENSDVWRGLVDVVVPPYVDLGNLTTWLSEERNEKGLEISYRIPGFVCRQMAESYRDGFGGFQRGLSLGVVIPGLQILAQEVWAEVDIKGFFERIKHREVEKKGIKMRAGKLGINWKWILKEEVREWVTTHYDFVDHVSFNLGQINEGVEEDVFTRLYEQVAAYLKEASQNEDLIRLMTSDEVGRINVDTKKRFTLPSEIRDFNFLITIPFQEAKIGIDYFKGTEDVFKYEWQNYLDNQALGVSE